MVCREVSQGTGVGSDNVAVSVSQAGCEIGRKDSLDGHLMGPSAAAEMSEMTTCQVPGSLD